MDTTRAVDLVRPLVEQVRVSGAAALYELDERFDGVRPPALRVPAEAMRRALAELDPAIVRALKVAITNARAAHTAQLPVPSVTEVVPGGLVYQRWVPLGRVGLYVPGGLAVYPSSVVMNVVAAQVAGVKSMVVATPPQKQFGGLPHPVTLAACELLGVDEVIAVGGAQAIAAMAFGFTDVGNDEDGPDSIPYVCRPVDKVTGPGNVYVAAAKRLVQSVCGIDAEAGTTEIAVLADAAANPEFVAADLISQAEHDPAAASVLVTDSASLVEDVQRVLGRRVPRTANAERIATALDGPQSALVLVGDLDDAVAVVQAYAPEHLEVQTNDALAVSERITTAGAVFLGNYTPVPLGDYVGGSNHVLPTGGTARYSSGLNVTQFLRSMQVVDYSQEALAEVTGALVTLANAEELPAHGEAALARFDNGQMIASLKSAVDLPRWAERQSGARAREGNGISPPAEVGGSATPGQSDLGFSLPWREELAEVEPYGAPMIEVPVRLNVNENPYPPGPEVADAIAAAVRQACSGLNRYADRDAVELRRDLAGYVGAESGVEVDWRQVWAANGSNEVMLQLLQAFGGPGRTALATWPTYSMYEEYARDTNTSFILAGRSTEERAGSNDADPSKGSPTSPEYTGAPSGVPRFDADALVAAMERYRPAVVFVPSPNNPTGEPVSAVGLRRVLEASRRSGPTGPNGTIRASVVIVDEAYAEFRAEGEPSALELLPKFPNLVVTRTLSKAFAAAGLRLGYLVASKRIVHEVQKVRLPYHLSLITQAAARAALGFAGSQAEQIALIRKERDRLARWLGERGFEVVPSSANFLLFGPLSDRHAIWKELVSRGVLIREVGPEGYLRVTVGTPEENRAFQAAVEEAL